MRVELGIKKKVWSDGLTVTMNNVAKSTRGGKANTWKNSFRQLPPEALTHAFLGSKACLPFACDLKNCWRKQMHKAPARKIQSFWQ